MYFNPQKTLRNVTISSQKQRQQIQITMQICLLKCLKELLPNARKTDSINDALKESHLRLMQQINTLPPDLQENTKKLLLYQQLAENTQTIATCSRNTTRVLFFLTLAALIVFYVRNGAIDDIDNDEGEKLPDALNLAFTLLRVLPIVSLVSLMGSAFFGIRAEKEARSPPTNLAVEAAKNYLGVSDTTQDTQNKIHK